MNGVLCWIPHRRQTRKSYEVKISINKILRGEMEKESYNKKMINKKAK